METRLQKIETGLDFATVAKILDGGMTNISSYIQKDVDAFIKDNGLAEVPVVLMATHSMGGRDWKVAEGRKPAFFEEVGFGGGWYVITDDDVDSLECVSATSGSSLTAKKNQHGYWIVTLEVPVGDDGLPYKGHYWRTFHEALGLEKKPSEEALPAHVVEFEF